MADVARGTGRGALIGFLGGILAGAAINLPAVLFQLESPDEQPGATAALGLVVVGILSVLGTILGGILGTVAAAAGINSRGIARSTLFGAILLTIVGGLMGASAFAIFIVPCCIFGGAVAGAVVGMFTRPRATPITW
jgi:hypothetical protein